MSEIIELQNQHSLYRNQQHVGKTYEVLIESYSKKSKEDLYGRTPQNSGVVFPKGNHKIGDYINVHIDSCTGGTLIGTVV